MNENNIIEEKCDEFYRCKKCLNNKLKSEFYTDNRTRNGLWGKCKNCSRGERRERMKELRKNPEAHKMFKRKEREQRRLFKERNPERERLKNKRKYEKKKREKPEELKAYTTAYRLKNKEHFTQYHKKWINENRQRYNETMRIYRKKYLAKNPQLIVLRRFRDRLRAALSRTGAKKFDSTINLCGCTQKELIEHIEKQFTENMSWENRHLWELDHISPCCAHDLTKEGDQRRCFHYTNLRPMWTTEHRKKIVEDKKKSIYSKLRKERAAQLEEDFYPTQV